MLDIYWIHSDFAIKGGLENSTEFMVAIIAETILLIKIGSVQLHLIH